ncbi:hypothetical protein ACIKT0_18760, partial [Hansschlegelia beijingensis]
KPPLPRLSGSGGGRCNPAVRRLSDRQPETADAALLKDRVGGVAELVTLSRATLSNIWTNVALALGLKGAFLVATLVGATPLWMAILADTGATVLVTANALRLLRFDPSDASR